MGGDGTLCGASGDYFNRTYTNLPAHNTIYMTFDLAVIDSIDDTDNFEVAFDNIVVPSWKTMGDVYDNPHINRCANHYWGDTLNLTVFVTVPHNSSSLTLKFINPPRGKERITEIILDFKNYHVKISKISPSQIFYIHLVLESVCLSRLNKVY